MPLVTLIIVTHDSARWLPGFLGSWRAAVAKSALSPGDVEVVIADSGSNDETREIAARVDSAARVLACGDIGYGAAANRAAAISSGRWILLCNPDLEFYPDFVSAFVIPATANPSEECGCIAPILVNEDDTGQYSIGRFPTIGGLIRDWFRPRRLRKYILRSRGELIDWATGACLLVRREHWVAVSGFDEGFFLYVEDIDFQRRLAGLGLRTRFLPASAAAHLGPTASRPRDRNLQKYAARGLLRYFAKHGTPNQLLMYRLLALVSLRLSPYEAFASRARILRTPTGP